MNLRLSGLLLFPLLGTQLLTAAPTANPDSYPAIEDQPANINAAAGVLANDSGIGTLTASLESDVSNGTLILNSDGSFRYTPDPNFSGTDSFTYRTTELPSGGQVFVIDRTRSSAMIDAVVSATLDPFGQVSSSDSDESDLQGTITAVVTPSSAPFSQINITDLQVSNAESVDLDFRFLFGIARVTATASAGGIAIAMVQASPAVPVGAGGSFSQLENEMAATGTVNITASGAAAGLIPDGEQAFDSTGVFVDLTGTITQVGNTLTLTAPFQFVQTFDLEGNALELDLDGNLVATSAVQSAQISSPATVTINVAPRNDSPSVLPDSYSVENGTSLTVDAADGLLGNDDDIDGDTLTALVDSPPANGTLELAPDGSFTYTPNPGFAGTDSFIYEAQDQGGATELALVPRGGEWRYLDDGSDQGEAWRQPAFDDASWPAGAGQLGYGDGDEFTMLTTPADPKPLTVYFRHTLQVPDASQIQTLAIGLLRDDGAAVYLNGTEVVRDNLAAGAGFNTPAATAVGGVDETIYQSFANIDPALLVDGDNVIAVEIHQSTNTSSDLSFDLSLTASLGPSLGVATIEVSGTPTPDSDGDGMDDGWELANGLIVGVDDAALDADGDGSLNIEEFRADTDPQDPRSLLTITSITRSPAGELAVEFVSVPGKVYFLEQSPDLATPFAEVSESMIVATETSSTLSTPVLSAEMGGFLRVRLLPTLD